MNRAERAEREDRRLLPERRLRQEPAYGLKAGLGAKRNLDPSSELRGDETSYALADRAAEGVRRRHVLVIILTPTGTSSRTRSAKALGVEAGRIVINSVSATDTVS